MMIGQDNRRKHENNTNINIFIWIDNFIKFI